MNWVEPTQFTIQDLTPPFTKMIIKRVVVGELETNCYIIGDGENFAIIDPGDEARKIINEINVVNASRINPTATNEPIPIILTHAHPDHIGAVKEIRERLKCQIYLHSLDSEWLKSMLGISFAGLHNLEEGKIINLGSLEIKIIHTPGHTPGSICLYIEKENILFSGDTLFAGAVGRTDLPGGDEKALQNSLKKLWTLPDSVKVYPGHGPETTIKEEKDKKYV